MSLPQIAFILIAAVAGFFFLRRVVFIRNNILMGQREKLADQPGRRWRHMALFALGQKKMFARPIPAIFHFFIYIGFIIINLEVLEIVLDGALGTHRIFAPLMGSMYPVFISAFEVLAVLVILACVVFLVRRWILRLRRFFGQEMTRWPQTDATLILSIEIVLMVLFLSMNTADLSLQATGHPHYAATGSFLVSASLQPLLDGLGPTGLTVIERIGWWGHIIGIFAFAIYITYSKHLHIFLAFPNNWYVRFRPTGEIANMDAVTNEVRLMLDPSATPPENAETPARFGAKDVGDLSWKNLMDAYSCTECGRCTSVCPANITGKKLSPRKVMMDTRDRMEELGAHRTKNGKEADDGKSLIHDYITMEELNACTTCQACVDACPVNIDPLDIIVQLRRYAIMEESKAPAEWSMMLGNIENNAAPWQFAQADRLKWADDN
jgi:heterodisulfide reductase subunit C